MPTQNDVKRGLISLEDRLADIDQKVRYESLQSTDADGPVIYHYTSPDGLIGILEHGWLRATNIRHFEDKSELVHAESIHEQVLDEIKETYPPHSHHRRLAEACRIEIYPAARRNGPLSPRSGKRRTWLGQVLDRYVACFSTCNNSLNQWRKYARGGFAIGFNRRELEDAIQPRKTDRTELVHLAKVRYSVEAQKRELRTLFDQYCSAISPTSPASVIDHCADRIVNSLALHASLFKRHDFEIESEWRIIIETLAGRSDVCFRSSADKVIPYLTTTEQQSGRLPVASISIGPAMDQDASERGVQALLDTKGYRGVKISPFNLLPPLTA